MPAAPSSTAGFFSTELLSREFLLACSAAGGGEVFGVVDSFFEGLCGGEKVSGWGGEASFEACRDEDLLLPAAAPPRSPFVESQWPLCAKPSLEDFALVGEGCPKSEGAGVEP